MYSGFYKTQIDPTLKDAWKLLLMVGYEKVGMCLELKSLPDASRLQDVAFEFYLASLECLIFKDAFNKVSPMGFIMKDYHQCRRRLSASVDGLFKTMPTLRASETRDERERCETKASHRAQDTLSKLSGKYPEYASKFSSGVRDGATRSESSHRQMGNISEIVPLSDQGKESNDCEPRSESIEALMQEITPEMIYSDVNIRRQILDKLVRPSSAKSQDEHIHASLPLHRVQREIDMRPHTEPLLIPKQLKPDVASTSDNTQPYSEPQVISTQPKTDVASASDMRPYTEPLLIPKKTRPGVDTTSYMQPHSEPLLIPKQRKPDVAAASCTQPYARSLIAPNQPKTDVISALDMRPFTEPLLIPKQSNAGVTSALDMHLFSKPLLMPKQPTSGVASTSDTYPFTESLLMPKHPQTSVTSALDAHPLTKRLPTLKQHERENKVVPNIRPYTEPPAALKQKHTLAFDQRPLLVPVPEKVSSERSSKEPVLSHWRCAYCLHSNSAVECAKKCELCGMARTSDGQNTF